MKITASNIAYSIAQLDKTKSYNYINPKNKGLKPIKAAPMQYGQKNVMWFGLGVLALSQTAAIASASHNKRRCVQLKTAARQ